MEIRSFVFAAMMTVTLLDSRIAIGDSIVSCSINIKPQQIQAQNKSIFVDANQTYSFTIGNSQFVVSNIYPSYEQGWGTCWPTSGSGAQTCNRKLQVSGYMVSHDQPPGIIDGNVHFCYPINCDQEIDRHIYGPYNQQVSVDETNTGSHIIIPIAYPDPDATPDPNSNNPIPVLFGYLDMDVQSVGPLTPYQVYINGYAYQKTGGTQNNIPCLYQTQNP